MSQAPMSKPLALPRRSFKWTESVGWLCAFALPWLMPGHALIINEMAIAALFAMSLDLVLGYAGIVTLGHAAFLGLGSYAAALFAKFIHPDPLLGLLVGSCAGALLGAACSVTILRGSDLTRLMVTLGVTLLLFELANKLDWLTGGSDGLQGVVMGPLMGRFEFDLYGQTAASYSLSVLCVLFIWARRCVHSPWGATLMAVRDNPLRASAIGISVPYQLFSAYTLAAAWAGAAGALLAQTTGFASLDVFALERSADAVLMLVIGGTGWLYGGLVGAVVFKLLHDIISNITPQYWTFWMGLFLVALMLLGRERLSWTRWSRWRRQEKRS